jgi:hypothetical protein
MATFLMLIPNGGPNGPLMLHLMSYTLSYYLY